MKSLTAPPTLEAMVTCRIAAYATMRGSAEAIAQWRKQPIVFGAVTLPTSFLKHAEDQTVLALKAVLLALEASEFSDRSFTDWGVIAAPNLFARVAIAQTLQRYQQEGAWGVSPHLIPHQSLHAMSGTISQALKILGPNFGVNGGPNACPDAFLLAAAMMFDRSLPGLWVVLSGHESEWLPAAAGPFGPPPPCQAVAIALTPVEGGGAGLHLSTGQFPPNKSKGLHLPDLQLSLLAEELASCEGTPVGRWRLADTHWMEIESIVPVSEVHE